VRPGTLAFSGLSNPNLAPSQVTFTWAVLITLGLGAVLALWSLLLFSGVIPRDSDTGQQIWRGLSVLFIIAALALVGMLGYNLMAASTVQPAGSLGPQPTVHIYRPPEIPATRLLIPDLRIDTELTEAPTLGDSWDVSLFLDEVAHLEGTAYPGTTGNAVLAGHVHHADGPGLFWNLRSLQAGNMIVAQGDGIEYRYQVEWVEIVEPDDVSVLEPADEPILTIISGTDWDAASWSYLERVVVRAKQFDRFRTG
jgi:LPXTG-site transpeptidase (sortase) family protein